MSSALILGRNGWDVGFILACRHDSIGRAACKLKLAFCRFQRLNTRWSIFILIPRWWARTPSVDLSPSICPFAEVFVDRCYKIKVPRDFLQVTKEIIQRKWQKTMSRWKQEEGRHSGSQLEAFVRLVPFAFTEFSSCSGLHCYSNNRSARAFDE